MFRDRTCGEQTILYSKLKARYINAHTNDRQIGDEVALRG